MTIVKWNNRPYFGSAFDPFFTKEMGTSHKDRCNCSPATNIYETQDSFVVELRVPGMKKEDFLIKLEKETLTLSSERGENESDKLVYTRKEFGLDAFSRSFILPKTVDADNIRAEYEQGILRLTLPKKEEEKQELIRQISIN